MKHVMSAKKKKKIVYARKNRMNDIKQLIQNYMSSWLKCRKCLQMCKMELIDTSYSDDIICFECGEEEK